MIQDLAASSFALDAAKRLLDDGHTAEAACIVGKSAEQAREGVAALRALVSGLYPHDLEATTLTEAIHDLLAKANAAGLATEFAPTSRTPLPLASQLLVYRMVRESLRNAIKHADATRITVDLRDEAGGVLIEVADNGKGFHSGAHPDAGHIGLRLLADLAKESSAHLAVDTSQGTGTVVRLEVPA